jgi:hypothetical protein
MGAQQLHRVLASRLADGSSGNWCDMSSSRTSSLVLETVAVGSLVGTVDGDDVVSVQRLGD